MSTEKPLNARCAEALGWGWFKHRSHIDSMTPGQRFFSIRDPRTDYFQEPASESDPMVPDHPKLGPYCQVPPYGDDTPEGWACTGPLIGRFGLSVISPTPGSPAWGCLIIDTDRIATGPHACAATAEWVAEHVTNGEVKA